MGQGQLSREERRLAANARRARIYRRIQASGPKVQDLVETAKALRRESPQEASLIQEALVGVAAERNQKLPSERPIRRDPTPPEALPRAECYPAKVDQLMKEPATPRRQR